MPGSGRLTTHVLDTMHGKPATGMRIDLLMMHGDHTHPVLTVETNADGRIDEPLLGGARWGLGTFELQFHVGQYFERNRRRKRGTWCCRRRRRAGSRS